jgi:hypothetical protein
MLSLQFDELDNNETINEKFLILTLHLIKQNKLF